VNILCLMLVLILLCVYKVCRTSGIVIFFLYLMLCRQLLLQKEREDTAASYKSTEAGQTKKNNVPTVPSASSAQEPASRENSSSDRMTALQALSAFAHPISTEGELLHGRSSPNFTASFQRFAAATSNVEMVRPTDRASLAFSRQMSDSAVSFAGAYGSFRSNDDATMHRSLDSTYPPAVKLKDTVPQYSFPSADGCSARSLPASSDVANVVEVLSASVSESMHEQSHLEFKAAYGEVSNEAVHNYSNVSGTINVRLLIPFFRRFAQLHNCLQLIQRV